MGLDMYLNAKKWIGYGNDEVAEKVAQVVESPFGPVKEVTVEAAYWRKANAIHQWFVENCQEGVDECQETWVSREHLERLRDICQQVVDEPSRARELLPPKAGFFFGSTDIDEYYLEDLAHTREVLDRILQADLKGWDFYYRSSW